jgi:hypothetical protein
MHPLKARSRPTGTSQAYLTCIYKVRFAAHRISLIEFELGVCPLNYAVFLNSATT